MTSEEISVLKLEYETLKKDVWKRDFPLRHSIFFWVFFFIALIGFQFDLTYIMAGGFIGFWSYFGVLIFDCFDIASDCVKLRKLRKKMKEVDNDEKKYR